METTECLFCTIIAGDIPSKKVYEDDDTVAFLDARPVHNGHTLVVPKKHCADFVSADAECLRSVLVAAQKVARAVLVATGADGCNVTTNNGRAAGQVIFHLHWHIIPRFSGDGLHLWKHGDFSDEEADVVAEKIRFSFSLDSGFRRNDKVDV